MLNPEFKRNLWREFPGHRLLAMPVMLGLVFLTAALADRNRAAESLYQSAMFIFVFIVWFWGARNANAALVDELRDQTWDQQRLSALSPWSMTWGKLFGATSYNWYGGLICLAVGIPAGLAARGFTALFPLVTLLAAGVLIQAAVLTLVLHLGRRSTGETRQGGIGWLVIVLIFTMFANLTGKQEEQPILWWSLAVSRELFLLAASLFFAGATLFAAWRVMSNALQVRTRPWAWPLFSLLLAFYLTGLGDQSEPAGLTALPLVGLGVALAMTYAVLFTEPTGPVELRRLQLRQESGDWRGWLEYLPLWPTSLAAALLYALLATGLGPARPETLDPQGILTGTAPLALALMLLRDCCLLLFFACAPQPRHTVWTTLLAMAALDFLLPFSFKAAGLARVAWLLMPVGQGNPWATVMVMTLQASLALGLLGWRWRQGPGERV